MAPPVSCHPHVGWGWQSSRVDRRENAMRVGWWAWLVVWLGAMALACDVDAGDDGAGGKSGVGGSATAEPISCGDLTCSGAEYCVASCTCCGMPAGGGEPAPQVWQYGCEPMPAGCGAAELCNCLGISYASGCDASIRTVADPCM